ncbi:hypothetical protein HaLaN_15139 [Haematococcus lacustris]|uniref:Uncharacterized protein n=1 Tax=Haematococcus lacustris TaxID=44745 RepID=A0A699Z6U0_HAELA|nr:hypothetical protein HaLaN_15139 [Haematococcus lacustris]
MSNSIRACADYRADPKQSAPVWATLEPSPRRCGRSPLKIDAQTSCQRIKHATRPSYLCPSPASPSEAVKNSVYSRASMLSKPQPKSPGYL